MTFFRRFRIRSPFPSSAQRLARQWRQNVVPKTVLADFAEDVVSLIKHSTKLAYIAEILVATQVGLLFVNLWLLSDQGKTSETEKLMREETWLGSLPAKLQRLSCDVIRKNHYDNDRLCGPHAKWPLPNPYFEQLVHYGNTPLRPSLIIAMTRLLRHEEPSVAAAAAMVLIRLDEDASEASFSGVNLSSQDLRNAKLYKANLQRADLTSAKFDHSKLQSADFRGACLDKASFRFADLSSADLSGVDVGSADFLHSDLTSTKLLDVNLSKVRGFSEEQLKLAITNESTRSTFKKESEQR